MRKILFGILLCILLAYSSPADSGEKDVSEFRKGITCHKDWIDRFRETFDHRILNILMSRAGSSGYQMTSTSGGKKRKFRSPKDFAQYMKDNPEEVDDWLEKFGIIRNSKEFEEAEKKKWKDACGNESLELETPHYLILSTKKDKRHAHLLRYYMEKIFVLYAKKFKVEEKIEGRFIIKLYPSQAEFRKAGGPGFAAAYFRANTRELCGFVPRNLKWVKEDQVDEILILMFFHEGFHQYFSYYVPNPPTWLNEGFACLFEGIQIRKTKLYQGKLLSFNRLITLKRTIAKGAYTPLKDLIYMNQERYYSNATIHYAQGWGLVHFLVFGSRSYRKYYQLILKRLKDGMEPEEAIKKTFATVDMKKMELVWKAYIKKLTAMRPKHSLVF